MEPIEIPVLRHEHLVAATLKFDRLGSLHVWIGEHGSVENTKGELYEMNGRECDLFTQFDFNQDSFIADVIPAKDEGSWKDMQVSFANGWEVHAWIPDDYVEAAEIEREYHETPGMQSYTFV